jgi:vancomycin permeability regulator SanA
MASLVAVTAHTSPRYVPVLAAVALAPVIVSLPWLLVRAQTLGSTRRSSGGFDRADAALVLGARVWEDGRLSRFLRERVEVGVGLYRAGVVDRIIMSGDGQDSSGFGEPAVMRRVAQAMGVPPDAIIEDPLGLDTYSSCVRAQAEYGATSVVVATQEFHVPRAVWVCHRIGLPAQGAYAPPRLTKSTVTGHIREVGATAKAVLDVARGREPH